MHCANALLLVVGVAVQKDGARHGAGRDHGARRDLELDLIRATSLANRRRSSVVLPVVVPKVVALPPR